MGGVLHLSTSVKIFYTLILVPNIFEKTLKESADYLNDISSLDFFRFRSLGQFY